MDDDGAVLAEVVRFLRSSDCSEHFPPDLLQQIHAAAPPPPREADLEVFRVVSEHFRNDFRMVWEHSNFFLVIQGAFLSVFASFGDNAEQRDLLTALAGIGIAAAAFWWWVAICRMRLVDRWRDQMVRIDQVVDRLAIFSEVEDEVRHTRLLDSTWIIAWLLPPLVIVSWIVLISFRN